jgi:hypothetical protein
MMKKIISAILITVFLAGFTVGCKNDPAATAKNVPVSELMTKIVANTDLVTENVAGKGPSMVKQTATQIKDGFYVDTALAEEYDLKISNNIVSANTVAVFKLKDLKNVASFQEGLNKRKDDQVKLFESYAPAEAALAKDGIIAVKGVYVLFVVSKDAAAVKTAFLDMLK